MPNFTLIQDMTQETQDHYAILGLSKKNKRKITADEIKAAYKQASLKSHPDKHQNDPKAMKKFQAITQANEILADPVKRREYDKMRYLNVSDLFPHFSRKTVFDTFAQMTYFAHAGKSYKGPKVFFAKLAGVAATLFFFLPWLLVESMIFSLTAPILSLGMILIPPLRTREFLKSGRNLKVDPLTTKDKVLMVASLFSPILWPISVILFLPVALFSTYRKVAFSMYSSGKASHPANDESTHKDMHAKMKPAKKSKTTKNDKSFEFDKVVSSKQSAKLHTKHPSPLSFMQSAKINADRTMQSALEESAMASYLRID